MTALTIAGKIAPRPSLPSRRGTSHSSAFARERRRHPGTGPTVSTTWKKALTPLKNPDQKNSKSDFRGPAGTKSVSSSSSVASSRTLGLRAQISDSGTTIVRVHEDMSWMLNQNQRGRRISSGGTAGARRQGHSPKMARSSLM